MMVRRLLLLTTVLFVFSISAHAQDEVPSDDDPNVIIHVVQRGENLFRIALGYGLTADVVAAANGISDPSNIVVGQRLIIPLSGLPQTQPAEPEIHIIQPGETLRSIAALYDTTVDALIAVNQLDNPDRIFVGQGIQVRSAPAEPAPAPDEELQRAAESSFVPTETVTHIVQRGETLFSIAQQYNSTVEAIQDANGLISASRILAGQELAVPISGAPSSQTAVDLPDVVAELNLRPLTLTEGRTGRLNLTTTQPATVSGQFIDRPLVVISQENNTQHVMLLPIPIYTEPGIYPLALSISQNSGQTDTVTVNVQVNGGGYGTQQITLPQDRLGLLSPGVEENEMNILLNVAQRFTPERYFEGSMSLPAAAVMNSAYGARRSYNGGAFSNYHSGADFAGAPGTPVFAAASGLVVLADTLNIRGNSVVIDHGWGVFTNYSHMMERYVNIGDFVTTGQTIGTVGNTGRATGAHLHWELWVNGVPVDPMQWVAETFP